MIIGHELIINFFEEIFKNGKVHHAYTFVGPNQVGKRTVAYQLGADLLHTTPDKLIQHPDFFYLERMIDEKSGKLKKDITVEQARRFKTRFQTTSWSGGYQVIVLDGAEFLNEEAGNALLKIIEEPPEKTIIFLLTTNEQALLPTIRSRTQVINFSLVSGEVIQTALQNIGCSREKAEELTRISWGRPGRAIDFLKNIELFQKYEQEVERFRKLLDQPFYVQVLLLEHVFGKGEKDDHIKIREELADMLEIWEMEWRDIMLGKKNIKVHQKYSVEKMVKIIDAIQEARKLLRQNIHPRLLIENIILEF